MSFENELDRIKKNLNDLYGKVGLNPRTIPPTLKRKEMVHNLYKGKMEPHYYDDREPKENALDKMANRFWERYKDSAEARAIEYQRAVELERIIKIIEQENEDAIIETLNQYFTDSDTTMNYFRRLLMERYFGKDKISHQEEIEEQIKQAREKVIIDKLEDEAALQKMGSLFFEHYVKERTEEKKDNTSLVFVDNADEIEARFGKPEKELNINDVQKWFDNEMKEQPLEYNKEMLSQLQSPLNNNHEVTNELNGLVIGDESSDFTEVEQEKVKELKPESKTEIHSFNTRSEIDVNKLREERTKALSKFSTVDLQEELNRRMKERAYKYD